MPATDERGHAGGRAPAGHRPVGGVRQPRFSGVAGAELGDAKGDNSRLVKKVEVDEEGVRIVYRVRPSPFEQGPQHGSLLHCWGRALVSMRKTLAGKLGSFHDGPRLRTRACRPNDMVEFSGISRKCAERSQFPSVLKPGSTTTFMRFPGNLRGRTKPIASEQRLLGAGRSSRGNDCTRGNGAWGHL